jgi:hypothetical protein
MSIAKAREVNGIVTNGSGTTKNYTVAAATAGNALRLFLSCPSGFGATSVSGLGVTWTRTAIANVSGGVVELWQGENSTGSGTTLTVTYTTSYGFASSYWNLTEWSGMPTSAVGDGGPSTSSATTASVSTASITPTASNSVLLLSGIIAISHSITAGPSAGWTALSVPVAPAASVPAWAYQIVASASGSYSDTWTKNASYGIADTLIAGWDGATGGGGGGGSQEESYWGGWHG